MFHALFLSSSSTSYLMASYLPFFMCLYKKKPPTHKAATTTITAITIPAITPLDNVLELFDGYSSSSYYYSSSSYYYSSSSYPGKSYI